MKNSTLFIFLLICTTHLSAQLFTKVTEGPLVNSPSDSRSVNFIDLNNDGWEDVFISNGLNGGQDNMMYINNGDGTFTSDENNPITDDNSPSVGATFADFDNDGDLDAYVTNWYGQINQLYRNNGTGQLELYEIQPISSIGTYAETAAWGDYDKDGWLDLYVTNSGNSNNSTTRQNLLFKGLGDGNFERITTGELVTETHVSRNVNWTDFDNDGDLDLFVSNESNQLNDLYENDGSGNFSKHTTSGGIVQTTISTMSSSWGDVDNDGDLDHFAANAGYFQEENNQLFINTNGVFTEDSAQSFATDGGCSYGSNFGDYDNDGDLDLIVMNGFCNANLKNYLYENQGHGTFLRAEHIVLPDMEAVSSYGGAWGDVNNDGFLDLIIANCKNNNSSPQPNNSFFINNKNENNWLKIHLTGTVSNQSAIGAKVRIKANINGTETWQMREVSTQTGYSGQNSLIVHFGLGDATEILEIKVEWPSGLETELGNISSNQQISIVEEFTDFIIEQSEKEGFSWSCFPNPSTGKIKVQIQSGIATIHPNIQFSLVDTLGKVLWTTSEKWTGQNNDWSLDFSKKGIKAGQYFLKMEIDGKVFSRKVILL